MTENKKEVGPTNTDKTPVATKPVEKAPTPAAEVKPTGSPQTAGTKDTTDLGHGGKDATKGNQSLTPVEGQTADNSPATGPGNHANIAGATQDPKNPAVVKSEDVAGKSVADTDAPNLAGPKDGDVVVTETGTGKTVDPQTQKMISDDELDAAANEPETPVPSDEDLDAVDKLEEAAGDPSPEEVQEQFEVDSFLDKLATLVLDKIPTDSPDSYNLFGYSGTNLSLGEFRKLARAYRRGRK